MRYPSFASASLYSLLRRQMPPPNSPLFFYSLLIIILSISVHTYSQNNPNTPFLTDCRGENFSSSSPYDSNSRLLLATLISSTPKSPTFFSLNNSTSPQIFGLAQCRPDLTPSVCADCLNQTAVASFNNQGCGLKKFFANRAGNCLIRYNDQMFYNTPEEKMFVYYPYGQNASDSFNRRVNILIKSVMASAAAAVLKFAVGVNNESADAQDIYGMGWCSIDLASSDCAQCLGMVYGRIPAGKNQGNGATVSCQVRFDTYQFYSDALLSAPAPEARGKKSEKTNKDLLIGTSAAVTLFLLITLVILLLRRRKRNTGHGENEMIMDVDTKMFEFDTLRNATKKFSEENKLGQGGFGPVYKGVLSTGQEIAVKRLSRTSRQGLLEMKNEVNFIAKLQHKNLVQLLGYCLEGEEKLLVYEYLPNGSLDKFLFDPIRKLQLNWKTRFKIIEEIGRGILYLHKDSRFKIVHRDLKVSNILLDGNMNPKISDFGLAELFGVDETQKNTERIAGTYGYMAPEYVLYGRFSTKSDVFSFGVLILEIITSTKSSSFQVADLTLNLPSYIWQCWNEGMALKMVDESLGNEYQAQEVLRCLHIGMLCVQEDQNQRPNMDTLILMLSTNSITLPVPSKPAFYNGRYFSGESSKNIHYSFEGKERLIKLNSRNDALGSINDITITTLEAR